VRAPKKIPMPEESWPHFSRKELECPCCGRMEMDDRFMQNVERLRRWCNFSFRVGSAFRCPSYNAAVSVTGTSGPHTTGRAIDIIVSGEESYILLSRALKTGEFTGIGVKQTGAHDKRFLHLDNLRKTEHAHRPRVWSYGV
jgi:zinc D-Ala-D-Ala carboxypeptidase